MSDVSKNSSAKYKVDQEAYDRNYERIFGKHQAELGEDEEEIKEVEGLVK